MKLNHVLAVLRQVAPEDLAEEWDKVGLQVGSLSQDIRAVLLCIDLTEAVVAEAIDHRCNLIVAYHPPIFRPLTTLTDAQWKERAIIEMVRRGVALYSPHTALDNVRGGITDWLCKGLGEGTATLPITTAPGVACPPEEAPGAGRIHHLRWPVSATALAHRIKQHLGVEYLKLAIPDRGPGAEAPGKVTTVAVCPGAGGSVFEHCRKADAYLTGEMQHHQVLDLVARGRTVILAGHTNTERPYLANYRQRILDAGGDALTWHVSKTDRAPMTIC